MRTLVRTLARALGSLAQPSPPTDEQAEAGGVEALAELVEGELLVL